MFPPKEKLLAKREFRECPDDTLEGPCWIWTGSKDRDGYGQITYKQKKLSVHRAAFILFRGPFRDWLELDHLCSVPPCFNPYHLEPVTHQVNVARGKAGKKEMERTRCPKGHPYNEENTYHHPNRNNRICRVCSREGSRKRREKNTNFRILK